MANNNAKSYNIGAVISDKLKISKNNDEISVYAKYDTPDTEVFDNLPHIRKAVDYNNFNYAERGYGNDIEGGGIDLLSQFQKTRTGVETGIEYAETGISYVFITKPNLNLTKSLKSENYSLEERKNKSSDVDSSLYNTLQNGFIEYIARNYPDIIDSLICNNSGKQSFIPLLFNHFRSFSLEDHSLSENTYNETFRGFNQHLPTTAVPSFGGGSLSITYDETNPPLITFLHKVWFDYIESVKFNQMVPSNNSINRREIDYMSSLYYFLLSPDGETIVFWAKYTGLFPQHVPYSSFGGDIGNRGLIQPQINYVYNHKDFLNPEILIDFNDTMMNSDDIMKAQSYYKGDIISIHDMDEFQNKLINATSGSSYDPGSNSSLGLYTMYEIKSSSIYQKKGNNLERRAFNNVGVFKKDKNYKLLFYN